MQLIYVWINYSENGIYREQGISLTDEYHIKLDLGMHKLEITPNVAYFNLFKSHVIENVSALVGANGTGKTNLLNYIFSNDILPIRVSDRTNYVEYELNNYRKAKTLQLFKDNDKLFAYHNFEYNIEAPDTVEIIHFHIENYRDLIKRSLLENVSKIYLTNSSYVPENSGYESKGNELTKIQLTPHSIRTICSTFYGKIVRFPEGMIADTYYNGLQNIIMNSRTIMGFQGICDVLYFEYLYRKKRLTDFDSKVPTVLYVSSELLYNILSKPEHIHLSYTSDFNYNKRVKEKCSLWLSYIHKNNSNINELTVNMKLNFVFELDFIFDIITDNDINETRGEDYLFNRCKNYVLNSEDDDIYQYYKNAISEIDELEDVISTCGYRTNLLPLNDLAYERKIEVNSKKNIRAYHSFIKLIAKKTKNPSSFILKYLRIENLKMSSGERAYLNFFSWLNLLPFFHKISPSITRISGDNILLLIDEIELYCHPAWQQKFIKYLLEELELQFPHKKIQIIFATHSPIVLSDIPLSNIVYIKKGEEDNLPIIENRNVHKETFGSNIYLLFDDAFYLRNKGAIGEYAKSKINEAISKIRSQIDDDNIDSIIKIIGEPIIKRKLISLYNSYKGLKNEKLVLPPRKLEQEKLLNLRRQLEKMIKDIDNQLW